MSTTLTIKGQVTIPKHIRDALHLRPGSSVDFRVNASGEVVLAPVRPAAGRAKDRFEAVRGKASVKWRTAELMKLLREDG